MKKSMFTLFAILLISVSVFSQDLLWNINTDTLQLYYLKDVVLDQEGNVYAGADGINSAYVLKYDKDGQFVFAAGSDSDVKYNCMHRSNEGRLILAGDIQNGNQDDAWFMVFDEFGNEVFTQTYDQITRSDEFNDIICDNDGYIYLCGDSYNSSIEQCGILAKYAPDGTPVWVQVYNKSNRNIHFDFLSLHSNGNISVTGINAPTSPSDIKLLNVTFDNNGMQLSEYEGLVGGKSESLPAFALTDDEDNQYIGGLTRDNGQEASFLLRLSDNNLIWFQTNPSAGNSKFINGCMDDAGNIYCCGETGASNKDAYCAKYAANGGLLSEYVYESGYGLADSFMNLTSAGDYVYVCGISEGLGTSLDMITLKLNADLELMWDIRYNSFANDAEYGSSIQSDYEGNIIIGGIQMGSLGYSIDVWKYTNPLDIDVKSFPDQNTIRLYPNPAKNNIRLDAGSLGSDARYAVLSASGVTILSGMLIDQPIDIGELGSGLYFIMVIDHGRKYCAKFVKQ